MGGSKMLHIKYDGKIYEYAEGTTYEEIAKDFQSKYAARIAFFAIPLLGGSIWRIT